MLGPIEKGANDGQATYAKDIVAALKAAVTTRRVVTGGAGKKGGKKRKNRAVSRSTPKPVATVTKTEDWGVFEPLHGILGPIVDILKPLFSGNMVYGLLVGLLVAAWFGFGRQPAPSGEYGLGWTTAERVAAYEEIWRREEGELWDWLEARVGMHNSEKIGGIGGLGYRGASEDVKRGIEESLQEEKRGDEDVREAIRVTEEKLEALKKLVEKNHKKEEAQKAKEKVEKMEEAKVNDTV